MTATVVLLFLLVAGLGVNAGILIGRARRSRALSEGARAKLSSGAKLSTDEWRDVFRETVAAAEGGVSPEVAAIIDGQAASAPPTAVTNMWEHTTGIETPPGVLWQQFFDDFSNEGDDDDRLNCVEHWLKEQIFTTHEITVILKKFHSSPARNRAREMMMARLHNHRNNKRKAER